MASVRVDLSDPTLRRICMTCASNWALDMERCPDCGSALLSRETITREFMGSVPHAREPVPEPTSLELLCTTTGEDEKVRLLARLEERELPYFRFSDEQSAATHFYIDGPYLDWAREALADIYRGGGSVLLARVTGDVEALTYGAALESRNIGYTTNQITRQYPTTIGTSETLFFVAEADLEAARRAIEEARDGEVPPPGGQEIEDETAAEVPDAPVEPSGSPGGESTSAQDMRDARRCMIARSLLYLSGMVNLFQGTVFLGSPALILGVFCVLFGAALVMLGRWSRRNPESAFAWALALLVLNTLGALVTMGWIFVLPGVLLMLAVLFAWRQARARRLERMSPPGETT